MAKFFPNFELVVEVKKTCAKIGENPSDVQAIERLSELLDQCPSILVQIVHGALFPILKKSSESPGFYSSEHKILIVDLIRKIFEKSQIDSMGFFMNLYGFLLFEVYDPANNLVLTRSEELKLSVMKCMTVIAKSVSSDLLSDLYSKKNAPKLCQILYVALEFAVKEQFRSLRIASIESIMSVARVLDDDDFNDVVTRNQIAESFFFFLPGIATKMCQVALSDEKVGHKVPLMALKCWGRIVTLLMQDYNSADEKVDLTKVTKQDQKILLEKFKNREEINSYLETNSRTLQWYKTTDLNLSKFPIEFKRLCYHSHEKVRAELLEVCKLIIDNCLTTMPSSSSHFIEIVITLSEDDCQQIRDKAKNILNNLSKHLGSSRMRLLLENLEDLCYCVIISLPRKFNGIDEKEQVASLNLVIGYIRLFGEHNFESVLLSPNFLQQLMSTLLHISEIEKRVSLLEEYSLIELEEHIDDHKSPWLKFIHFNEEATKKKLQNLCSLLGGHPGSFRIVSDFLLDTFLSDLPVRKEATFLLNCTILGVEFNETNNKIIHEMVNTYIEPSTWNLSTIVDKSLTLSESQNNLIQICLLLDGLKNVAQISKINYNQYLLKTMYLVLERAGSSHPLVRTSGLQALRTLTTSCNYSNITDFVTKNIDYFTFYVERKLRKDSETESALNVMSIVLCHTSIEVLTFTSHIIEEVMLQSCDKFKARNALFFLNFFRTFTKCVIRWLKLTPSQPELPTRKEREAKFENFQVSGVEVNNDFSDDIMEGKTAEELWKEDQAAKETAEEEPPEDDTAYKKAEPVLHVRLTVAILRRSLHFLPGKNRDKQVLVLEILKNGLEVIRDWEDELLPVVHQIWSPLVGRFEQIQDPLVVNFAFGLLETLGRLSRDFIRMRTVKEVLPILLQHLVKLSKDSFLKDKGSAYRYSQAYKLQVSLLSGLGKLLIHLDVGEEWYLKSASSVSCYLSCKQPVPLQESSLGFFKLLHYYDPDLLKKCLDNVSKQEEFIKNVGELSKLIL